jgi:hypothetical protein
MGLDLGSFELSKGIAHMSNNRRPCSRICDPELDCSQIELICPSEGLESHIQNMATSSTIVIHDFVQDMYACNKSKPQVLGERSRSVSNRPCGSLLALLALFDENRKRRADGHDILRR